MGRLFGNSKEKQEKVCPRCNGTGKEEKYVFENNEPIGYYNIECSYCKGTGKIKK